MSSRLTLVVRVSRKVVEGEKKEALEKQSFLTSYARPSSSSLPCKLSGSLFNFSLISLYVTRMMSKDKGNGEKKHSFLSFFFSSISFLCEQSSLVILRCFYIQYKENMDELYSCCLLLHTDQSSTHKSGKASSRYSCI